MSYKTLRLAFVIYDDALIDNGVTLNSQYCCKKYFNGVIIMTTLKS